MNKPKAEQNKYLKNKKGNAMDVIGVELNRDAIRDARMNARENKIRNVRFVPGDAGWFMEGMAAEG